MQDSYLYSLIAFSTTDIIGYNRFLKIKKSFPNLIDFLDLPLFEQISFLEIKTEKSHDILKNIRKQTDWIFDRCQQKNIHLIPHSHPLYPSLLKEIDDPPYLLYVQGNFNPHIPLIGVIGTRQSTYDAEQINRWFCKEFVQYGVGVISGLAAGHDSIAAQSVLENDGYTVGILGTAIDEVYPRKNKYLFDKVIEKGAIISEYPPGIIATKWRFPRRNRIVSGMSQAICVMQAPKKSGTMITVNMALSHNKEVYVIPGSPLIKQYEGTNNLIAQGCKIALNPQLIIQETLQSHPNTETIQFLSLHKEAQLKSHSPLEEKIDPSLSPEEQQVLTLCHQDIHIDELLEHIDINISSLNSLLTIMELKNLLVQKPGQIYLRRN